jgi:hypothetical protein
MMLRGGEKFDEDEECEESEVSAMTQGDGGGKMEEEL